MRQLPHEKRSRSAVDRIELFQRRPHSGQTITVPVTVQPIEPDRSVLLPRTLRHRISEQAKQFACVNRRIDPEFDPMRRHLPCSALTEERPSSKVAPMTDRSRLSKLTSLLERIDRRIAHGVHASATLTRWRLVLFLAGLVCTVTLYKLGWYNSGNLALAGFVALFIAVAAYHNRLENRIHRLRQWKTIKAVHRARIRLEWAAIPLRSSEQPPSHLYANDLDLIGLHSLTHLLDTTVSDHGRERLRSWLLSQPPDSAVWAARQEL